MSKDTFRRATGTHLHPPATSRLRLSLFCGGVICPPFAHKVAAAFKPFPLHPQYAAWQNPPPASRFLNFKHQLPVKPSLVGSRDPALHPVKMIPTLHQAPGKGERKKGKYNALGVTLRNGGLAHEDTPLQVPGRLLLQSSTQAPPGHCSHAASSPKVPS